MKDYTWTLVALLVATITIEFLVADVRNDARRHAAEAREDARAVVRACRERGGR